MVKVANFVSLKKALDVEERVIEITRSFLALSTIFLSEGVTLRGVPQEDGELPILMFSGTDGVGTTQNNTVEDLYIYTDSDQRAIFNASVNEDLGTFDFKNLKIKGQFGFITHYPNKFAYLNLESIRILDADTRKFLEQPQKYGVNVLQGALTIYNFTADKESKITVNAHDISVGEKENPVIGSGVFISGFGDVGGRTEITELQTRGVYSTGKIPFGVSTFITGAIFIVNGAHANTIIQDGETITYGVNDMVLDAWGEVDEWVVNYPVISYGPSGVGFVNFGTVTNFKLMAALKTYGIGARGYNQYDGSLEHGTFQDIETFGDGSVGIQVSKHVGNLEIDNIHTHGSIGNSLVKGVNVDLPAYAISIKEGGSIDNLVVQGNIETSGDNVTSYIVDEGGNVNGLHVKGEILARGSHSEKFKVVGSSQKLQDF